jgi:hypothetical protein
MEGEWVELKPHASAQYPGLNNRLQLCTCLFAGSHAAALATMLTLVFGVFLCAVVTDSCACSGSASSDGPRLPVAADEPVS